MQLGVIKLLAFLAVSCSSLYAQGYATGGGSWGGPTYSAGPTTKVGGFSIPDIFGSNKPSNGVNMQSFDLPVSPGDQAWMALGNKRGYCDSGEQRLAVSVLTTFLAEGPNVKYRGDPRKIKAWVVVAAQTKKNGELISVDMVLASGAKIVIGEFFSEGDGKTVTKWLPVKNPETEIEWRKNNSNGLNTVVVKNNASGGCLSLGGVSIVRDSPKPVGLAHGLNSSGDGAFGQEYVDDISQRGGNPVFFLEMKGFNLGEWQIELGNQLGNLSRINGWSSVHCVCHSAGCLVFERVLASARGATLPQPISFTPIAAPFRGSALPSWVKNHPSRPSDDHTAFGWINGLSKLELLFATTYIGWSQPGVLDDLDPSRAVGPHLRAQSTFPDFRFGTTLRTRRTGYGGDANWGEAVPNFPRYKLNGLPVTSDLAERLNRMVGGSVSSRTVLRQVCGEERIKEDDPFSLTRTVCEMRPVLIPVPNESGKIDVNDLIVSKASFTSGNNQIHTISANHCDITKVVSGQVAQSVAPGTDQDILFWVRVGQVTWR